MSNQEVKGVNWGLQQGLEVTECAPTHRKRQAATFESGIRNLQVQVFIGLTRVKGSIGPDNQDDWL